LLSKPNCSLCDEAARELRRVFGRRIRVIDITLDRELEDVYVFRIPVLLLDETVVAEGRIDRRAAREAQRRTRTIERSRRESA
jgi:hypothetical protein